MTNQPSYRFGEYTEPWEEKKLSEVTDYKNGKGYEDRQSDYGSYELINLNSISIDGGLKRSGKFIDKADETLERGDLVMVLSDVGHGNLLGRVAIIPDSNKFVLNQRVALLRPRLNSNSRFLYSYINSNQYYFKSQGAGMSQLNISKSSVENFSSYIPSLPEQTAIGSFFQDIDQLISLQQRKLEVLKEKKKTYLKLLFPAKGQTKPALRFAGFEDEWKEVKLGEVCSIKGGNAWKSEHYSTDGKYLVVTISNVKGNEYIDDTYGNRIDTVESQFILEQGDILISLTGNVGRVSKMTEVAAVLNQRVGKLATNQSNNFLFTLLSNRNFEKEMVLSSQGAAQANISNNDVLNYKTSFPSLPEQEAIGSFFQDLDKAIAKQEEKVNQLKESKQTLLRKMFI